MAVPRHDRGHARSAEIGAAAAECRPLLRQLAARLYRDTGCVGGSDLVQDVLLDALRCPKEVLSGTDAQKQAWLQRVLVRKVSNRLRDQARAKRDAALQVPMHPAVAEAVVDRGPSPAERLERIEQAAALGAALAGLTVAQQEAVRLRYQDGLSLAEIAARAGTTVASVKTLLDRALDRLRHHFGL